MRLRFKLFLVKTFIFLARGVGFLSRPIARILAVVFAPLQLLFVGFFRLLVLPTYTLYLKLRREFSAGGIGARLFAENRNIQHIFIVLLVLFSLFYSLALRGFAAEDLGGRVPILVLFEEGDSKEFLVEETDEGGGAKGLGYIPLGFSDLDKDDEEVFALIAGGGAFVRPLAPTGAGGAPTRLGVETYTVEAGDTVSSIANKFGVSINTVLWANNLTVRSVLRAGQKLTVPPTTGVVYTVKRGDTIDGIALKHKGDRERIIAFNNLASQALQAGQTLVIPDGRIPPPPPPPPRPRAPQFVPTAVAGKMLWPIGSKRITQYYWLRHPAIDVGASQGTPVYASESGIVEFVKYGRTGYGYQLMIDHGGGIRTRYAHNSRILVKAGDPAQKGQVIAYSGNTGRSTGPHLHFEIFIGGRRANPLQYIR